MCGILISARCGGPALPLELRQVAHRGPDGSGEWRSADGCCWLGHTRLAILDLSANGAQPMADPLTGNVIAFNGEIYNHLQVRGALGEGGRQWRSTSDTETLLAAYGQWGLGMLQRLKGMFAFAVYDAAQRAVFLVRDRLGIKPLYYARTKDGFFASSEVRPLLEVLRPALSPEGLSAYLQWGACQDPNLLFAGVSALPAGHWLRAGADGSVTVGGYWPPENLNGHYSAAEPAAEVRRLLEKAVEEHLLADVPVAVLLSGGTDSSVITALAARSHAGQLHTFSVGFGEEGFRRVTLRAGGGHAIWDGAPGHKADGAGGDSGGGGGHRADGPAQCQRLEHLCGFQGHSGARHQGGAVGPGGRRAVRGIPELSGCPLAQAAGLAPAAGLRCGGRPKPVGAAAG